MEPQLNIPVFELDELKRAYWAYVAINALVLLIAFLAKMVFHISIPGGLLTGYNFWIVFALLATLSIIYGQLIKKELRSIVIMADHQQQHAAYRRLFKKRLLWNLFSVVIDAMFFIMTGRIIFLYILILQAFLSLLSYPNKKLIVRELNNPDIVFS